VGDQAAVIVEEAHEVDLAELARFGGVRRPEALGDVGLPGGVDGGGLVAGECLAVGFEGLAGETALAQMVGQSRFLGLGLEVGQDVGGAERGQFVAQGDGLVDQVSGQPATEGTATDPPGPVAWEAVGRMEDGVAHGGDFRQIQLPGDERGDDGEACERILLGG
jgi:hypothetical protein